MNIIMLTFNHLAGKGVVKIKDTIDNVSINLLTYDLQISKTFGK